jgi:hypothetical protein
MPIFYMSYSTKQKESIELNDTYVNQWPKASLYATQQLEGTRQATSQSSCLVLQKGIWKFDSPRSKSSVSNRALLVPVVLYWSGWISQYLLLTITATFLLYLIARITY